MSEPEQSISVFVNGVKPSPDDLERFWRSFSKRSVEECWEWIGVINSTGYGFFYAQGKNIGAHRASWAIHIGAIPKGLFVLHKCDNKKCVNPNHLFLGTTDDNMDDMVAKNRQANGARNGLSKLTDEQVRQIRQERENGALLRDLAKRYGVNHQNISQIAKRITWRHVD